MILTHTHTHTHTHLHDHVPLAVRLEVAAAELQRVCQRSGRCEAHARAGLLVAHALDDDVQQRVRVLLQELWRLRGFRGVGSLLHTQ